MAKRNRQLAVRLIARALNEAARDAVEAHRRANVPLVVWQDGQVVTVSPENVILAKPKKPRRGSSS